MQNKVCCFSGHRPKKIPFINNQDSLEFIKLKNNLFCELEQAILQGYTHFISGMALGFDILCANCILDLKKKFSNLTLELALPCLDQTEFWQSSEQDMYDKIYNLADKITIVSPFYTKTCMQNRNKYMVDKSSLLICYCNGKASGTSSTIKYAKSKNITIINLYNF